MRDQSEGPGHRTAGQARPPKTLRVRGADGRYSSATAVLVVCLVLSGCTASEPEPALPDAPTNEVSVQWIEREVRVHTLDRMFDEGDPNEIVTNTGGARERLVDAGIVREDEDGEDGFVVELDKDRWSDEVNQRQVDGSLGNIMRHNEVAWCGGVVSGDDFVSGYLEEYQGAFGTTEEYTASVADYVDCGTGTP